MASLVPFWANAGNPIKRRLISLSRPSSRRPTRTQVFSTQRRLLDNVPHKATTCPKQFLYPLDTFPDRHIGPSPTDVEHMLAKLVPSTSSLDDFIGQTIPAAIRSSKPLDLRVGTSQGPDDEYGPEESSTLSYFRDVARHIQVFKSYIGCGYYGTLVPEVIKRNVLEN